MITVIIVFLIVGGAVVLIARSMPRSTLGRIERLYLFASPAPLLLALVVPDIFGVFDRDSSSRTLSNLLSETGIWLSLAFVIVGLVVVVRSQFQTGSIDGRLILALFVAAIPTLLVVLIYVLFDFPLG